MEIKILMGIEFGEIGGWFLFGDDYLIMILKYSLVLCLGKKWR